jgi:hypothetical protein
MPLATTVVSLFVVARYGVMLYVVGVIVFPLTGLNPVLMSFGGADIRASDVLFPVVLLTLLSLSSIEGLRRARSHCHSALSARRSSLVLSS